MHYAGMAWTLDTEVASAEDVRSYWENAAPIWEVIHVGQQLSGFGAALQPMIGRTSAAVLVVCFFCTPLIGAPLRGRRDSLRLQHHLCFLVRRYSTCSNRYFRNERPVHLPSCPLFGLSHVSSSRRRRSPPAERMDVLSDYYYFICHPTTYCRCLHFHSTRRCY